MSMTTPITPGQKARIKKRIHLFLEATRKEKPIEVFTHTFLWVLQTSSVLKMMEFTRTSVTGRFEDIAKYLEKKREDDKEQGFEVKHP